MDGLASWVRENPAVMGVAAFASIALFVFIIMFVSYRAAGQSIRPLLFVFGFIAIVAVPQGFVHLLGVKPITLAPTQNAGGGYTAESAVFATSEGRFTHPDKLFGANYDPQLVRDARPVFGDFLAAAEVAELAFYPTGETTLVAAFPDSASALAAHDAYGSFFQLQGAEGSDAQGWAATRPSAGDRVYLLHADRYLLAWTGADDGSIAARREAVPGLTFQAEAPAEPKPAATDQGAIAAVRAAIVNPWVLGTGVGINLVAAIAWFFVGSSWATRVEPVRGVSTGSLSEVRERLLAMNDADSPIQTRALDDRTVEVTWRYADAKWVSLASAHGLRKTHKLVIHLNEKQHTARVREYWAAYDWSAGQGGAHINWQGATGMKFFDYEKRFVVGAQLGKDGKPTGDMTYTYTFNIFEMKQPAIDAVTGAGWVWAPVMMMLPGMK